MPEIIRSIVAAVWTDDQMYVFGSDGAVFRPQWNVNGGIEGWVELIPIPGTERDAENIMIEMAEVNQAIEEEL